MVGRGEDPQACNWSPGPAGSQWRTRRPLCSRLEGGTVRKGCGGRATALERDADSGLGTRFAPGHDVAAAQGTPAEAVIVRAHDGALSSVEDQVAAGGTGSGR